METLFGHLATRFACHPENLATQGLHFILSRSAEGRRLFLGFLKEAGVCLGSDLTFDAQAKSKDVDQEESIPDLVGKDTSGAEVVILEAKFWAGLTKGQPNAYLDRLAASGLLVFVAPAARFETLWPELLNRCRDGGRHIAPEEPPFGHWRSVRLTDGKRLALTSWRALLDALSSGLQRAGEVTSAADVFQLRGLADRMDVVDAFLPLTSEELTSNLGTRILQYCRLIDDVVNRLVKDNIADARNRKASGGMDASYRRLMRIHNTMCRLYFGPGSWSAHGKPIWLEVRGTNWAFSAAVRDALYPLERQTPPKLIVNAKWGVYVPIELPIGMEREAVLDAIVRQIANVADLVRSVPMAEAVPGNLPDDEDDDTEALSP